MKFISTYLILFLLLLSCAPSNQANASTRTPTLATTETPTLGDWQGTTIAQFANSQATNAAHVNAVLATATAESATRAVLSSSTPTLTRIPSITFKYQDGVAAADRKMISDAIDLGKKYFGETGTLVVSVFIDRNSFCLAYFGRGMLVQTPDVKLCDETVVNAIGVTGQGQIIMNTGSRGWQNYPAGLKMQTVIHEYVHAVQGQLIKARYDISELEPTWLVEGSAEYLSLKVIAQEGLYNYGIVRVAKILEAKKIQAPLSLLESRGGAKFAGSQSEYTLGFLAAEFLDMRYADKNFLIKYFELGSSGTSWRGVFRATFDISVDDFYKQFEEYRRLNFPPNP